MRTRTSIAISVCVTVAAMALLIPSLHPPDVMADSYSSHRVQAFGYILDNPTLSIAGSGITTSPTSTTGASSARVAWVFGTVTGSYTGCTVQTKTSIDGTRYLALGTPVAVNVATNAVNAWDIYQQAPVATGVTTTAVSSSSAAGFGQLSTFVFACSSYGTAAPVAITAIYK